jgi:alkaline phosphatase D
MGPVTSPFTHAVASFDPTARSVLLWTRAPGVAEVTWTVARDPALTDVVASGRAVPDPGHDHTVRVDVDGLEPDRTWFYGFRADERPSPTGRTRTLPADGRRLRLGLVSCARFSVAPLGVYRALAEREVDLVVHLGDYIYEDDGSAGARAHVPPRPCRTLDDYRARLGQIRSDPDAQALHLRHPMVAVLDDHDVADNCWTDGAKKHVDEEDGPWADRVAAATGARQEWLPQRLRDLDDPRSTWRSVPVGDLAELLLLDTRLSGRDQQAGDEGTKALHDPARSLLGDDQRRWLDERLADATRPWAVLVSGVVVNEVCLPVPALPGVNRLLPNGYAVLDGQVLHDDQWDGYPHERTRLSERLAARGRQGGRALILSGDVHSSWAFEGPVDEQRQAVAVEMTIPSVSSKPMGRGRAPGAWRLLDALVRRLPHVRWADVTRRGFGIVELTPERATLEWWFVEPTADDPGADAWLGAAWTTSRDVWPPRLVEASATVDPTRPGLTGPAPPRPADLPRLQRSHRVRVAAARGLGLALTAAVVVAGSRVRRRVARRR